MVKRNLLPTIFAFTLLVLSLSLVSSATSMNNVTLSVSPTSITNATVPQQFTFNVNITNSNDTENYFVVLSAPNTVWDQYNETVMNETSESFVAIYTTQTAKPQNFLISANFYNESDHTQHLFTLNKSIPINYYTAPTTPESTFCKSGEKGDLEISDFYIDNLGFGDDEEWEHLDRIELVVEVYNNNRDDRINDILLQIMVKDRNGNDVTKDFEFEDEEIEIRRIRERDSSVAKFIIKEIPIDIDEDVYKIYIKAYVKGEEENTCVSRSSRDFNSNTYHEIEVIREDDPAVYVRTTDVQRLSVICGQRNVEVTVPVYNFGSSREDRVLVTLTNSLLGISESQVISNLRSGRKTDITFLFNIPQNLDRNTYDLALNTYFDVDDLDGDLYDIFNYDESSSSLGRTHVIRLEVTGCQRPVPSITATLDSVASTEEELVVKAIVRNNDIKDLTFAISATEFESWATLVSITPQVPLIKSGDTQEVIIRLMPTEAGLRSFKISVTADGETYVQPVSVNITGEEEKGSIIDGIDDITLFLIIGIVLLLILILIILIIRATRRSKKVAY